MRKHISLGAAFVVAASIASPTMAELTANVGATSNYIWRGVTQTADDAAVSGGIDYSNESGLYAGTWTSNVSGGHEVDLYFGYAGQAGDVEYDAGYIYYAYNKSGNADGDFGEINANASIGMISGGFAYTVNSGDANKDAVLDTGDLYLHATVAGDLEQDWSWAATVGYYDFDADGDKAGDISYAHLQADLSKSMGDLGDFTFGISSAEQESGSNDPKVVVSWAKSF